MTTPEPELKSFETPSRLSMSKKTAKVPMRWRGIRCSKIEISVPLGRGQHSCDLHAKARSLETESALITSMRRFPVTLLAIVVLLLEAAAGRLGAEIVMGGDARFDSDSVRNADSNQWRWLSFPGSRLTFNPVPGKALNPKAAWDIPPLRADLPLNLGGFVGTRSLRLWEVLTVRLSGSNGTPECSESRSTAWFPYKLTFEAAFSQSGKVSGCDFCVDANGTVVREIRVQGSKTTELRLGGKIAGTSARWEPKEKALLITGSDYFYALKLARLDGADETASPLPQQPVIGRDSWELVIPVRSGSDAFAVSFGFAPKTEGPGRAIGRAASVLAAPLKSALADSKAAMDGLLRKVPVPMRWGIDDGKAEVSASQHRRAYYAAWAFLLQNLIDPLPENREYPYPQIAAGKASLWDEGERTSPATCSWESLFGCQWLSLLSPDLAWQAYDGLMTRVNADGMLGGESLPSRKAQTAWILFKHKPDRTRLEKVYPALKRYLLWREKNPRWVYGTNSAHDEKDIEFAVSWLVDVNYAIQIADELGVSADAGFWKKKQEAMLENMRKWFYADSTRIEQFYFADSKSHGTKERHENIPMMIATALYLKELPSDLAMRTQDYFRARFKPGAPIGGFPSGKHPDLDFTALGLLDRNMPEARVFVQRFLGDAIKAGEFAEVLEKDAKAEGVKPSLFSPINIIEFTWLLNNVRYESGTPTVFEFKTDSETAKN